jgi:DNA-binding LacI/PurR family transcriptional regulator
MAVTMKDIAVECKVSSGAVSQVLRNPKHERFSKGTRKRILEVANRLNYRPNRLSQALRQKRSNIIGLVLPWDNPELMDKVEAIASDKGYKVMVQFTASPRSGKEIEALEALMDWNVDGIIWLPYGNVEIYKGILDKIAQSDIKMVFLQRPLTGYKFDIVDTDYAGAIEQSIIHMKDQGYSKVYYIFEQMGFELREKRKESFNSYCDKYIFDHEVVILNSSNEDRKGKLDQFVKVHKNASPFSVICSTDWMGAEFLEVLEENNLKAPDDIGVAIIGDLLVGGYLRVSNLTRPRLTALRQNGSLQAKTAVDVLLERIAKTDSLACQHITIPMDFIANKSTMLKEKDRIK